MVNVTIRVESYPTTDYYYRYHGLGIDQDLDEEFWKTQPHKVIGVTPPQPFTYETTVDLAPGEHKAEYATSGYVPDYAWHAKIYVNDKLVAEGDVGRLKENHLIAKFVVEAPPTPPIPPAPPWLEQVYFGLPLWAWIALTITGTAIISGVAYYFWKK